MTYYGDNPLYESLSFPRTQAGNERKHVGVIGFVYSTVDVDADFVDDVDERPLKGGPLPICKYTKKKKAEAVFECKYLINHPLLTSLIICSTESNASDMLGV